MNSNEHLGSPENPVSSLDILSDAIEHKFKAHPEEVSTYCAVTGKIFETLELGTAYLRREMLSDGSRGLPDIGFRRTTFSGTLSWTEKIVLNENGDWVYRCDDEDFGGHQAGDKVSQFRKGIVIAKVLAGRPKSPDRWADDPNLEQDLDKL